MKWIILAVAIACPILFKFKLADRSKSYYVSSEPGIVVITGATSGLGLDSAFDFSSKNYLVLAGARSQAKADKLQAKASAKGFGADVFRAIVLDVTQPEHWTDTLEITKSAMSETGREFNGLINNAGVHHRMFMEHEKDPVTMDIWHKVYDVNIFAVVGLTQVFDSLIKSSKARIVNVGSVAGEVSVPMSETYSSTKFALRAITDAWRGLYSMYGVSVSLVAPGYVRSQMCDPKKEKNCQARGPEDTTTPAYFDAITSTHPKSKYIVSDVMFIPTPFGELAIPGTFMVPFLNHFVPSRVQDMIVLNELKKRVVNDQWTSSSSSE